MSSPQISVVVLAWNQLELTQRCVASLRTHTDVSHELVIVDNGSDAAAADWARSNADLPILNKTNLGFSAGMNAGLAAARAQFVAFVNNDTVFPAGWAATLLATFDDFPGAGLVLPAVTAAGNPFAVRSDPGTERIVVAPFRHLPSGVVYVLRRETAIALGGWSEEFEVASREDLDLLFKVWCNDLHVVLDERVLVHHESSATVAAQLPDRRQRWEKNWDVFVDKWTHADAATVPRITQCSPLVFEGNLERARIAATWMERWYESRFRARPAPDASRVVALQRERDDLVVRLAVATSGRSRVLRVSWSAIRRITPKRLREWAFPKMRGLYYTAFPERKGGARPKPISGGGNQGGDDTG